MREPKKLSTRIFSRSKYDICLSNVGSRCTGIFKQQMVGSLSPPHTCSEMMESRTPRTAIFDPLCACLYVVQRAQKADALFVCVRLSPSEITGVAARIAATVSVWKSVTNVFGIGYHVFIGCRRGDSPGLVYLCLSVSSACSFASKLLDNEVNRSHPYA